METVHILNEIVFFLGLIGRSTTLKTRCAPLTNQMFQCGLRNEGKSSKGTVRKRERHFSHRFFYELLRSPGRTKQFSS